MRNTLLLAFLAPILATEVAPDPTPTPTPAPDPGTGTVLCQIAGSEPDENCGSASGQCFSVGDKVERDQDITLCVGFQATDSLDAVQPGSKVMWTTKVDEYSRIKINTIAPNLASPTWSQKSAYHYVWVGGAGKRTVGQQRGVQSSDGEQCLVAGTGGNETENGCYGWRYHNKPLVTEGGRLVQSLTALVHVDMGEISYIMWDSNCNLCPGRSDTVSCMGDNSSVACASSWWGGSVKNCTDCYADIAATCLSSGDGCEPTIYVAWVGTDKHGQNMLSAGRVISRFAAGSMQGMTDAFGDRIGELSEDLTESADDTATEDATRRRASVAPSGGVWERLGGGVGGA